jgi:hypothetical protein
MGFAIMLQLWRCTQCDTKRTWGAGKPSDTAYQPLLNCAYCHKPTRHEYNTMSTGDWQDFSASHPLRSNLISMRD